MTTENLWNGDWGFDPSQYIVCALKWDEPKRLITRKEWAEYNRKARLAGEPVLIETRPYYGDRR